jgi:hypothetical protein
MTTTTVTTSSTTRRSGSSWIEQELVSIWCWERRMIRVH